MVNGEIKEIKRQVLVDGTIRTEDSLMMVSINNAYFR
jgi:hypothetical protein